MKRLGLWRALGLCAGALAAYGQSAGPVEKAAESVEVYRVSLFEPQPSLPPYQLAKAVRAIRGARMLQEMNPEARACVFISVDRLEDGFLYEDLRLDGPDFSPLMGNYRYGLKTGALERMEYDQAAEIVWVKEAAP